MRDDYMSVGNRYKADLAAYEFPHYSNAELQALHMKMLDGDKEARDALWMHGVRLVEKIVKKWANLGMLQAYQVNDARQEGNLAIGQFLSDWSPNRGRFSTYAWVCIRGGLHGFLYQESRQGFTGEGAENVPVGPMDYNTKGNGAAYLTTDIEGINHEGPENLVIDVMDLEAAMISTLTDKEQDVIERYYFLDQNDVEQAELKSTDRSSITRTRQRALSKLQEFFE